MRREAPQDALHSYLKTVNDSLIDPLKKNQSKLSWQREIKESKRFQDAENKLGDFFEAYTRVKDNFIMRDKILDTIRNIHATRMTQFLETGKSMETSESEDLRSALAPYFELLQPVEEIRRLQNTMLNQGKLKKMPLPYDELNATLNGIASLCAKMPDVLMDGISDLSESLEKVA